ncbi:hypothetical protein DZK25_00545 [Wenzhouxiangella sp. 15181]|nr:hypothetical protein DZK25_00545 [Wenzhouxiangella sp. 15181]RFP67158.1 hypothetical protein DZK26_14080 [Wenzhouxiangella sp. 15190]
MTTGKEIRAGIDSEQVRGLLLINGGAAVALIALIPFLLDSEAFLPLARGVFAGLVAFQLGLVFAVLHNRLRRKCSLEYERAESDSPNWPDPCRIFGWKAQEPCVCMRSTLFMWLSVGCFILGGLFVAISGFKTLG